jgi:hypothetical protein
MKKSCAPYWDEILEFAEKGVEPGADHHVASCQDCSQTLAQARRMVVAFSLSQQDAPANAIQAATALMPAKEPIIWAKLLRSNVAMQGVRSATNDIQALFEASSHKVQVQYRATRNGWEVLGQITPKAESGEFGGKKFAVDDLGRFKLRIKNLMQSSFLLRTQSGPIMIPSIDEGPDGG